MKHATISKHEILTGNIVSASSEYDSKTGAANLLLPAGLWRTKQHSELTDEYVIIDYGENALLNFIELVPSSIASDTFPDDFRFEWSKDLDIWQVLHSETGYELEDKPYQVFLPVIELRYLKIIIPHTGRHLTEIASLNAGTSGIRDASASSSLEGHSVLNLFSREKTSWASSLSSVSSIEHITIDLGNPYPINRLLLISSDKGFPENFHVNISLDDEIWVPLLDIKGFKAENNKKYFWDINIVPARYIRIEARTVFLQTGKYGLQLQGIEISAAPYESGHVHNTGDITPYASVFQAGVVKFAKDGEDAEGKAVQGNDWRLRDATTIFKGITQLAADGDVGEGLAVQASDSRLKAATETRMGIVRLASDGEIQPGAVVQGNDSRIKTATTEHSGIVRICPDGFYSAQSVITGNDSRIHKASVEHFGIVRLAADGETQSNCVVQADDRRLRDGSEIDRGIIIFARDGASEPLQAVQGSDRRLKDATTSSKGIVELAEDGEDKPNAVVQSNDRRLKDATTTSKGIVKFAENGEDKPGIAVQGNDRRLKDATTSSKGIVKLAEDGEDKPETAVQGNDRRLKNASELKNGIVRFAHNGEDAALCAVQGNDKRLKDATISSKGIVELAKDGEDKPGVAIQGNDRRLKDATTTSKGIVELAEDGEDKPETAVQGNDKRLKNANELKNGIVRFAYNGEDAALCAVQGNDKRLKDATISSKGIVELAEDGEDKPETAVQGNDKRLKNASEESYGIMRFAKIGETRPLLAVQSNDDRLSDPRPPLPHDHDFAPLSHEFNSHNGTISITDSKSGVFNGITPPTDSSAVIYAKNNSESASIALAGVTGALQNHPGSSYGVVGHSRHVGVRGQSTGSGDSPSGCGVMGISRFGAGGVFSSEHGFAVIADGYGDIRKYDGSLNLIGEGNAFYVNGKSVIKGTMKFVQSERGDSSRPGGITEMFESDETDYISAGDVLITSERGESILSRSTKAYDRRVIGTVSGNPTIILNNSGKEEKLYPVALSGKAVCKVDARNNPVKPGDLIVTSTTPGCAMAGTIDSFEKIGTVIGKALERLDDGIGLISVFLTHS